MTATEDLFIAPKKTCRWAREEIDNFETAEKAFLDANPGKEWEYLDGTKFQIVHGIRFTAQPSDELERGAYRVVSDLRNALDQSTYAASRALGAERLKRTNFPFGEGAKDFKTALESTNGNYKHIPAELHPKLTSFQPYWRAEGDDHGDDVLRGLAYMANPNKHQVPLAVQVQTGMKFYGAKNVVSFGTIWDWAGSTELYRTIPGLPHEIDMELVPRIALGRVDCVLAGKPALASFRQMYALVDGIILGLEAEVVRLLAARK